MRFPLPAFLFAAAYVVASFAFPSAAQVDPRYDHNCSGCTSSAGANGWYCANSGVCWAVSGCGGQCADCVALPSGCPAPGELPQYNGNCTACTSSTGGNGYYCADPGQGTCWSGTGCGGGCENCIAFPAACGGGRRARRRV